MKQREALISLGHDVLEARTRQRQMGGPVFNAKQRKTNDFPEGE